MIRHCLLFALLLQVPPQQPQQPQTVNSIDQANEQSAIFNSPNGTKFKIDFWSDPSEPTFGVQASCSDNHFSGHDRKSAKTSAANTGAFTAAATLSAVINSLPTDAMMRTKVTETSPRSADEKKGVVLDHVFLYAFKRESDNDYHLIIGDNANFSQATLMNMEISGLPGSDNPSLDKARSNFVKAFNINDQTCMSKYVVFLNKPVPVHIEGPVFYDVDHKPGTIGPVQGSKSLRPRTSWEIHPITVFSLR